MNLANRPLALVSRRPALRVAPRAGAKPFADLRAPELYLSRELTWLAFNRRVLAEARNEAAPILERVKFLSIVGSNLDEFFMKRIGGLKQVVAAGLETPSIDGRTPRRQIVDCVAEADQILTEATEVFAKIRTELTNHGIFLHHYSQLSGAERNAARGEYARHVLPMVTPLGFDLAHPFPVLSNLSLNLLVTLRDSSEQEAFLTRIKVPVGPHCPRFLRLGTGHHFVPLEEVMAHNLDLLFPDCKVESCHSFRVIRNASTDRGGGQAEDLLALIEAQLRDRRFAPFVRLELAAGIPAAQEEMLVSELGLDAALDVGRHEDLLGMADLSQFASLNLPALLDPPHRPAVPAQLPETLSVFDAIRSQGSIPLQHPFESFSSSVERFVDEASCDPDVLAIKATLYRTSENTRIVGSLVQAALSGKQVAVTVELKARFDEAANVRWARRLEEAGVHVSYGVIGLKTHCKAMLVVRNEPGGLRR